MSADASRPLAELLDADVADEVTARRGVQLSQLIGAIDGKEAKIDYIHAHATAIGMDFSELVLSLVEHNGAGAKNRADGLTIRADDEAHRHGENCTARRAANVDGNGAGRRATAGASRLQMAASWTAEGCC